MLFIGLRIFVGLHKRGCSLRAAGKKLQVIVAANPEILKNIALPLALMLTLTESEQSACYK